MWRVLSDLHLHDSTSRVRAYAELDPLLEGVTGLVLNGDTCDTQTGTTPEQVAALQAYFRSRVGELSLITGNHDPDLAGPDETWLREGRVWVTHGDILFPDLNPWSNLRSMLRARLAERRARVSAAEWDDLALRLRHYRAACLRPPQTFDSSERALLRRLHRALVTLFPPTQLWRMMQAWRTCAARARTLAARHRPAAQVILVGHTHRPFVSAPPGRPVVINTGSFSRPFGAFVTDLVGDRVIVRRVRERRRAFHPGPVIAAFSLAPPGLCPQSVTP
jgi:predicted phosphodiesterase